MPDRLMAAWLAEEDQMLSSGCLVWSTGPAKVRNGDFSLMRLAFG
jgi:hypothetical protein